jgi:pimeloyl-ACP methyl ester carboxylesterase
MAAARLFLIFLSPRSCAGSPQAARTPLRAQGLLIIAGKGSKCIGHVGNLCIGQVAGFHLGQVAIGPEKTNQRLPKNLVNAEKLAKHTLRIPQALSAIGLLAQGDPAGSPGPFMPPTAPGTAETYNAILAMSPRHLSTLIEEHDAVEATYAAARNLPDRNLGDLPLVVISAGDSAAAVGINLPEEELALVTAVHDELQADLATLSSSGRWVIAEDAGHYVHLDQPGLVVDAIREVVEAARE